MFYSLSRLLYWLEKKRRWEARNKTKGSLSFYGCNFHELEETHDLTGGVRLAEKSDLFLADHRCNLQCLSNNTSSAQDFFLNGKIQDMMELLRAIMSWGAHKHEFFSRLQFSVWYYALKAEVEDCMNEEEEEVPEAHEGNQVFVTDYFRLH